MDSYEVEVKSLLGNSEEAQRVRAALQHADPATTLHSRNKQLNHYFTGGSLEGLASVMNPYLASEVSSRLNTLAERATTYSVRTRDKDGEVFLVVKAAIDDTSSENGIARLEIEERVELLLEELDALLLRAGFTYQAKWSREREEYQVRGTNVTLDKNAGYGWLAEFERMVESEHDVALARNEIDTLMTELAVTELTQDRLARMFNHYNEHWPEYYGTDKVFIIE